MAKRERERERDREQKRKRGERGKGGRGWVSFYLPRKERGTYTPTREIPPLAFKSIDALLVQLVKSK